MSRHLIYALVTGVQSCALAISDRRPITDEVVVEHLRPRLGGYRTPRVAAGGQVGSGVLAAHDALDHRPGGGKCLSVGAEDLEPLPGLAVAPVPALGRVGFHERPVDGQVLGDRKSTRLNSSH